MANKKREPTKVIRVPVALVPQIEKMVDKHRKRVRGNERVSGGITFARTLPDDEAERLPRSYRRSVPSLRPAAETV